MGYKDIVIPEEKDPEDYSYHERRAELLQFALEAGHPDMLSRTEFAKHYGVVVSTITKDFNALRDEIRDELGSDAEFITEAVYQKALKELMKDEEWAQAVDTVEKWNNWLFEIGVQERAPQRVEADVTQRTESTETETYELLSDDSEITVEDGETIPVSALEDDEDDEYTLATDQPALTDDGGPAESEDED